MIGRVDGLRIAVSDLVPTGRVVILRQGQVVNIGAIADLKRLASLGDDIVVSRETWESLQAEFARDVTPKLEIGTTYRSPWRRP